MLVSLDEVDAVFLHVELLYIVRAEKPNKRSSPPTPTPKFIPLFLYQFFTFLSSETMKQLQQSQLLPPQLSNGKQSSLLSFDLYYPSTLMFLSMLLSVLFLPVHHVGGLLLSSVCSAVRLAKYFTV